MKGKVTISLKDYEYLTDKVNESIGQIERKYKLREDELEDRIRQLSGRIVELEYVLKDITDATKRTDICVVAKIDLIIDILNNK